MYFFFFQTSKVGLQLQRVFTLQAHVGVEELCIHPAVNVVTIGSIEFDEVCLCYDYGRWSKHSMASELHTTQHVDLDKGLWWLPGSMGVSPVSISLRVKSVGRCLGFCQNQKRLRFTTNVSISMTSFRLDTGISNPPWSTSSTKFLVAVANISSL